MPGLELLRSDLGKLLPPRAEGSRARMLDEDAWIHQVVPSGVARPHAQVILFAITDRACLFVAQTDIPLHGTSAVPAESVTGRNPQRTRDNTRRAPRPTVAANRSATHTPAPPRNRETARRVACAATRTPP